MRVSKDVRKDATLLMLHHRKIKSQAGEADKFYVTSYTIARWHSIPQSNVWKILDELWKSRFLKKHSHDRGETSVTFYSLSKRGQKYVDKHVHDCIAAQNLVFAWKLAKYKRSLSK